MKYAVKEMFYTLQGEGFHTGRPAVFVRFTGCNLWTGREEDRTKAVCWFCDTDFVGTDGTMGGRYTADELAKAVRTLWPNGTAPFVVCTGGEPLLQVDDALLAALHSAGCYVAVETNGTVVPPKNVDWVCVSPKAGATLQLTAGDELKLVYPQSLASPAEFDGLVVTHRWLQPMDGPDLAANTQAAIAYCLSHPEWRLSVQTHKLIGLR